VVLNLIELKQMSDKFFIDTNILVYFYTKTELTKLNVLEKLLDKADLVVSTQVLNELSNVLFKKFNLSTDEITILLQEISRWCVVHTVNITTIIHALSIIKKYKFSYFDGLMIAAALECNCKIMYSEDMHHNCLVEDSLRIVNPFKL
jgi:predicted nucleic acid-binding protein